MCGLGTVRCRPRGLGRRMCGLGTVRCRPRGLGRRMCGLGTVRCRPRDWGGGCVDWGLLGAGLGEWMEGVWCVHAPVLATKC